MLFLLTYFQIGQDCCQIGESWQPIVRNFLWFCDTKQLLFGAVIKHSHSLETACLAKTNVLLRPTREQCLKWFSLYLNTHISPTNKIRFESVMLYFAIIMSRRPMPGFPKTTSALRCVVSSRSFIKAPGPIILYIIVHCVLELLQTHPTSVWPKEGWCQLPPQ